MTFRKGRVPTVELFAGAGLLAHAFKSEGAKTVLAVEADGNALKSLRRNVAPEYVSTDAREVISGVTADLLIGGPPCQGFSSLGSRNAADERNALSLLMVDWAKALKPKVVLIENVPQFLESTYYKQIKRSFAGMGYQSSTWILDASEYGAPQLRRRGFAVFSRIGLPIPPAPTRKRSRTVAEAFDGLPKRVNGLNHHTAPKPGELALKRFKLIPRGGDKRDVMRRAPELCPPSWSLIPDQATDVWGRMLEDAPANTIRCRFQNASVGRYIHPTEHRVISLREGARLQGVPDNWMFDGEALNVSRQIGNGVPIPLGRAVARTIISMF